MLKFKPSFLNSSTFFEAFLQLADLRAQSLEVDAHSTSAVTKAAEQGTTGTGHTQSHVLTGVDA